MILLYANPHEVEFVDYPNKFEIGTLAWKLKEPGIAEYLKSQKEIILFGSSGYAGNDRIDYGKLIEIRNPVYVPCHVGEEERYHYNSINYHYVDMESYQVHKFCKEHGIKFRSIRYVIDRCGRRCVMWGFNHFWRKWQHWKMQTNFNKWIEENYG